MATPAASPLQQRYNAGSCRLDVTLQPSALSQWYPRPVSEQLTFKLWLQATAQTEPDQPEPEQLEAGQKTAQPDDLENAELTLIAEGDRTALQAIAQHIQHQTRQTLTVGTLNSPRSNPAQLPPSGMLPPGCLVEGPLSYLQLCDLTSVLNQYEQAAPSLPVTLNLGSLSETRTASQPASPSSPATSKNNLIPFHSNRRRRTRLWASSAAAALFAVGITTTLVTNNQPQNSPTPNAADAGLENLNLEAQQEISAARPSQQSLDDTQQNRPSSDTATPQSKPGSAPGQSSTSALNRDSDNRSSANRSSSTRQPETPAPSSEPSPRPGSPSPRGPRRIDSNTPAESSPTPSSTTPNNEPNDEIALAPPPRPQSPPPTARPQAATAPSPELQTESNDEPLATAGSAVESIRPERIAVEERLEGRDEEAGDGERRFFRLPQTGQTASSNNEFEANSSTQPAITAPPAIISGSETDDVDPTAATESANVGRVTGGSTAADGASPDSPLADAPAETDTLNTPDADTIAQVQAYFQSRWQANQDISEPLTYQLQLSETGDVISFAALNSTAQTYRDRLIPNNRPLSFAINGAAPESPADTNQAQQTPAGAALTLRIILTPTGQVQVVKI